MGIGPFEEAYRHLLALADRLPEALRPKEYDAHGNLVLGNAQVGRLVLIDLRSVDVEVNDLAVLAELFYFTGHPIVEPHA